MKLRTFLSAVVLSVLFISCGRIPSDDPLIISFNPSIYETTFYIPGETEVIFITSSLGEPEISLGADTPASVSYNPANGRIEWTHELPIGDTSINVTAVAESGQQATTNLVIDNSFDVTFAGGYNFDSSSAQITSFLDIEFNDDGTLELEDDSGNKGTGTWELSGGTMNIVYSYNVAPTSFYTFYGTLVYNSMEAYIDGFWYQGSEPEGVERGYFRIDFQG